MEKKNPLALNHVKILLKLGLYTEDLQYSYTGIHWHGREAWVGAGVHDIWLTAYKRFREKYLSATYVGLIKIKVSFKETLGLIISNPLIPSIFMHNAIIFILLKISLALLPYPCRMLGRF